MSMLSCEEVKMHFSSFILGQMDKTLKNEIIHHLQDCRACSEEFKEEKVLFNAIKELPVLNCPGHIPREVIRKTVDSEKRKVQKINLHSFRWQTAVAGCVALALLLIYVIKPFDQTQTQTPQLTQEDIEKARAQYKWSMMYVAQKLKQTEKKAIREVVIRDLPGSVQECLKKTIPIL